MLLETAVHSSGKSDIVERWFFRAMAITMLVIACAGFLPSIAIPSGRRAPLSLLAAAHGVVFFAWLGIFLAQAVLVADRRIHIHRRLGVAAAFVAAVMIPLGYVTCIAMVRRGFDLSGDLHAEPDPAPVVVFPLGDILFFTVFVAAALTFRRRPQIHKTMILFANIVLMPAPLAHLIGHVPALTKMPAPIILVPITLLIGAAVAREFIVARTVHRLTWATAAVMLLSGPLRAGVVGPSATWHVFVRWLAR